MTVDNVDIIWSNIFQLEPEIIISWYGIYDLKENKNHSVEKFTYVAKQLQQTVELLGDSPREFSGESGLLEEMG